MWQKHFLISLSIIFFLIIGTIIAVMYGRGYRFGLDNGRPDLVGTGLLVATSVPNGAEVYVNGHLTTATDNTINLAPGDYTVKIQKAGFFPWEKKLRIEEEVVAKAEALLFPTAPKLESITTVGVQNPTLDPSLTRLAYTVSSQSARKNGVYVLDMTARPILTLQNASTQIADDTVDFLSQATLSWSPDGQQVLATVSGALRNTSVYALRASGFNENPQDVTQTLASLQSTWQKELREKQRAELNNTAAKARKLIQENFRILSWSPDQTKILYAASRSAELPYAITPRLIGRNPTPEARSIKRDAVYLYDIKEDTNFAIDFDPALLSTSSNPPLIWYPDSKHLLVVRDKKIEVMEYDGSNRTTIYAGPFIDNYVFPWTNGTKIVILTTLGNPDIPPNLYTISFK